MSTVIGGPHRCNIHPDFPETDDEQIWREHCEQTEGHTITGTVPCEVCGASINFENIPYQYTAPKLKCADCYGKQEELQRLVLNSVSQQQQYQGNNQQQQFNNQAEGVGIPEQ